MNAYVYLALHDIACVAGICYLVSIDSPWWATALLLLLCTTTVSKAGG